MIDASIDIALRNKYIVLVATLGLIVLGVYYYRTLPTDAFPDISPVMVPVFTEADGMAPEEVERLITIPVESALNGLPDVRQLKSTSAFGMNVIYVYFEDHVDIYAARQLVAERLSAAAADLPALHEPPALGPISTGLGEVFMYNLTIEPGADTHGKPPLSYLREINDWQVKYQIQAVPGVTDVLSMGGNVLQYHIELDPYALHEFGLALSDVVGALSANNRNAGGQFLVLGSEEYLVRGIGLVGSLDDIRAIRVASVENVPVTLAQIARVSYGAEIRRGAVTRNGEEEVVSGIVLKLIGENTSEVLAALKKRMPVIQRSLPDGVRIDPFYDQGELVRKATSTLEIALLIGGALVLCTLLLFLGDVRSALIVAVSLPAAALAAVLGMAATGLSANLMTLGGIAVAIGMLCDGAIVMVENIHRHLADPALAGRSKISVIAHAAREVARPIVFSLSIVIIVFLPVFTLQGVEGKMFLPMASTVIFAVLGAILVAIVISPVLSLLFLKQKASAEGKLFSVIRRWYAAVLTRALRRKAAIVAGTLIAFSLSMIVLFRLGAEFVPTLEEGTLVVGVNLAPSSSLEKNVTTIMRAERMLLAFDEVVETVSKTGRPEAGGHPHPVNYALIQVKMRPRRMWKNFRSKKQLVEAMAARLQTIPGIQLNFTQPIQHLFDDLITGTKSQLAIKLFGPDLHVLESRAHEIRNKIQDVEGLVDLSAEQSYGQPQFQIVADRKACAQYGIDVEDVLEVVELAIGGEVVGQVHVSNRRFDLFVRYQPEYRDDPAAIEQLLVSTGDGRRIPLSQVARIEQRTGPLQINREKNQRRWMIQANVRGRDMGSVVREIQKIIEEKIVLPAGYYLEYGGQFENQQRAMKRLLVIVPVALALILLMLYLAFHSLRSAVLVMLSVPLSLIGGIVGLYVSGEYLSVPAAIGFIALFGIAVQDAMVMVTCINQLRADGEALDAAVIQGALLRLRPVCMTTVTTLLGLLPLLLSRGAGAEVQRPLAVVVTSGLASSTLLTLLVKPALYHMFERDAKTMEARAGR
jgi:cobalt-zinc-cadmium resistance protein CzcA